MKKEKLARVSYNKEEDEFILELWDDEYQSYGFCCSAKCRAIKEGGEANFIHFTFMKEIVRCAELGYDVFFKGE